MASTPRSVRTARDNQKAQALGYKDYYDYRVHGYGRLAPGQPVTAETRERFRGHRSSADLTRLPVGTVFINGGVTRDKNGRVIESTLVALMPNGSERRFALKGKRVLSETKVKQLIKGLRKKGMIISEDTIWGTP